MTFRRKREWGLNGCEQNRERELYRISTEKHDADLLKRVNKIIDILEIEKKNGMEGDDFFENVCIETFAVKGDYGDREERVRKNNENEIDINDGSCIGNELTYNKLGL